jgi:hypothetical protein
MRRAKSLCAGIPLALEATRVPGSSGRIAAVGETAEDEDDSIAVEIADVDGSTGVVAEAAAVVVIIADTTEGMHSSAGPN